MTLSERMDKVDAILDELDAVDQLTDEEFDQYERNSLTAKSMLALRKRDNEVKADNAKRARKYEQLRAVQGNRQRRYKF